MTCFKAGSEYDHSTIVAAFGGEPVSYLPQRAGRIVCGRFKAGAMNPNAPYEVLVGNSPRVARKAELLASQGESIPVFIKEAPNRWRYHGAMRCARYDERDVAVHRIVGGGRRGAEIAGVLRMVDERTLSLAESTAESVGSKTAARHANWNRCSLTSSGSTFASEASALKAAVSATVRISVWILAIAAAIAAGAVVGIGGLLATAITGRRRRYRRRRW